ncbi:MAG: hypothetical protein ACRDHZ_25535, partial [Ktedonobacteraceae bacterium]
MFGPGALGCQTVAPSGKGCLWLRDSALRCSGVHYMGWNAGKMTWAGVEPTTLYVGFGCLPRERRPASAPEAERHSLEPFYN